MCCKNLSISDVALVAGFLPDWPLLGLVGCWQYLIFFVWFTRMSCFDVVMFIVFAGYGESIGSCSENSNDGLTSESVRYRPSGLEYDSLWLCCYVRYAC